MDVRIDFTDRHDQHPGDVKDYALEKVGRLPRYFNGIQHIEVILDKDSEQHSVEVLVHAAPNLNLVGTCTNDSVMAAIDIVADKLERQVKKAKERLRDHRRGEPSPRAP